MADVSMTYESLQNAASQVTKAEQDLDEVTKFLDNTVKALEGNWVGKSYTAFVKAWTESKPTMVRLREAVGRLAPELNKAAADQMNLDTQNANRMENLSF